MPAPETAFLFPGQGSYHGGALALARQRYTQVDSAVADIDAVSEELFSVTLSDILFADEEADLTRLATTQGPWVAQLAIYTSSIAAHQVLAAQGMRADVYVGHSLGEIAALVAAGVFSVRDGARIVAERVRTIEELDLPEGRMVALAADEAKARQLVEVVNADTLSVAAVNHAGQTICSGPRQDLVRLLGVARLLEVTAAELTSPYPFHSPVLAPAVPVLAERLGKLTRSEPAVPVYSPIDRAYHDGDDELPCRLAAHLIRPVWFAEALDVLHRRGVRRFVEVGALNTLGRLVGKVLPGDDGLEVFATLDVDRAGRLALEDTLAVLGMRADSEVLRAVLAPELSAAAFAEFWERVGPDLVASARDRISEIGGPPADPRSPAPSPTAAEGVVAPMGRDELEAELRKLYANALEYPEEVFTDDVQLEAELGIDSVKQVELLRRSFERFGLPTQDETLRVSNYGTLSEIAGLIHDSMRASA